MRARPIVLGARFKAGERDSHIIDVNDFLVGLVLEEQGLLTDMLSRLHGEPVTFVQQVPGDRRLALCEGVQKTFSKGS